MRAVHTGLYVIMGVSGSGKSLIGAMLGRALDVAFVEGDDLHPQENVKRMAAGIPLTDEDRHGWLLAIAARLRTAMASSHPWRSSSVRGIPAAIRFTFSWG